MKKSSTFQIIILCVFGAIGVAAVLIFAIATTSGGGSGIQPVTMWGTADATTMKEVLQAAAATDARFMDVSYVQKDPATYESDLANALASGSGPDLFIIQNDQSMSDMQKAYIFPYSQLSVSQFQSTFVDGADTFMSKSGVVAIPILVDPLVMYWNKDLFSSAGIAQPPQYWDQVPALMQELVQKAQDGTLQKEGIALGTYTNINAAEDILSMFIMQAGGQITAVNDSGQVLSALGQSGVTSAPPQQALSFYTEFANPSQPDYSWNNAQQNAQQTFAAGGLGMYVGYASEEPLIVSENPNLNFGVAAVPQVRNSQYQIDEGTVYAVAIPRNDPKIVSAQTIAFLMASTPMESLLSAAFGVAPASRAAISQGPVAATTSAPLIVQQSEPLFFRMALIVRTWFIPDPTRTASIFQGMIDNTESGAEQLSDAVGKANEQLQQLLAQAQPQSSSP